MSKSWLTIDEMANAAQGKYLNNENATIQVDASMAMSIARAIAKASMEKADRVKNET